MLECLKSVINYLFIHMVCYKNEAGDLIIPLRLQSGQHITLPLRRKSPKYGQPILDEEDQQPYFNMVNQFSIPLDDYLPDQMLCYEFRTGDMVEISPKNLVCS
jgi:hypothetical protein